MKKKYLSKSWARVATQKQVVYRSAAKVLFNGRAFYITDSIREAHFKLTGVKIPRGEFCKYYPELIRLLKGMDYELIYVIPYDEAIDLRIWLLLLAAEISN